MSFLVLGHHGLLGARPQGPRGPRPLMGFAEHMPQVYEQVKSNNLGLASHVMCYPSLRKDLPNTAKSSQLLIGSALTCKLLAFCTLIFIGCK